MSDVTFPQHTSAEQELKRCIARLSYAGMGLSTELDLALGELRADIKNNCDQEAVKEHIDNIGQLLHAIEDNQLATNNIVSRHTQQTYNLIGDHRVPSSLKALLEPVPTMVESGQVLVLAQASVDILLEYLHQVTPQETLEPGLESPAINQRRSPVTAELRGSLQQLIDQLASMESYRSVATSLTEKVVELEDLNQLVEILEQITGAFIQASSKEQAQLENFLQSLNVRIDKVSDFVDGSVEYSHKVAVESRQLDQDVKAQVSEIKNSVNASDSIVDVRALLTGKIDQIEAKINSFRCDQEANVAEFQKDIGDLQQQLKVTHEESSRLRDELAAQRLRAQTDHLTQLPNRYSYNERLKQEFNRWRRYGNALSMVICDIDLFKRVNDQYGHTAGDQVLKRVSAFLQASVRDSDFIARFGGEEFVLLLPETPLLEATKAMNKLRLGIKELAVEIDDHSISTTMSFGIAEFEQDDTAEQVFTRADKALYRAKDKGRDQVCCQRAKPLSE